MRIPFISRLSVMKVNPKGETPFDQRHNVRRKTFISFHLSEDFLLLQSSCRSPFPGDSPTRPKVGELERSCHVCTVCGFGVEFDHRQGVGFDFNVCKLRHSAHSTTEKSVLG